MADILRSILQIVNGVIALVEKRESLQLNPKQCRCLSVCVTQVRDYLCSGPIRIHRQVLERISRTVKKVESFVIKCCNRDWLVNTLSVGVSEEEIKDFILELRWCLSHVTAVGDRASPAPQMALPFDEDIRQDRQSLVEKLHKFLSGTRVGCEKRALALYVQGRLKILQERAEGRPSLKDLLWKLKLQEPNKYEHLGRGASALVFKTSWLGVEAAMKSLSCCGDKFLLEAGALAMLNHPNVVRLYCCYEDRKHQSLVMELMDGSLFDLLHERRESRQHGTSPFDLDEAVEILLQIVKGMLYLHKNGFAHRDLKSLNILVSKRDGDLIVKVADLDLVKLCDPTSSNPLTVSQRKVGTHVWRAPEVLKEKAKIRPRKADVYSFGMVFYEILTGNSPFHDLTGLANKVLHKKIVREGLRPSVPDDCPPPLRALIQQCWHANPELRPTFEEIHDRLLAFRSVMLETSVVETQEVQGAEYSACVITRALMPFVRIWEFFLSLCANKQQLQINNKLHQFFSFRMGPLIKMWEYLLPLRMNHTEVDSQTCEKADDQAASTDLHAIDLSLVKDLRGLDNTNVPQPNCMGNTENMRRKRSCGCNRTNCPLCTMWFLRQIVETE